MPSFFSSSPIGNVQDLHDQLEEYMNEREAHEERVLTESARTDLDPATKEANLKELDGKSPKPSKEVQDYLDSLNTSGRYSLRSVNSSYSISPAHGSVSEVKVDPNDDAIF